MASATLCLFVFLGALATGMALTCYKCDSSNNALCGYGLTSFTYSTVNCDDEVGDGFLGGFLPKQCVKLVARDGNDKEYIARGCMPGLGGSCQAVAKTLSFFGNIDGGVRDINCYSCDQDKCNSAVKYNGFTFLGVLIAAVAFLF